MAGKQAKVLGDDQIRQLLAYADHGRHSVRDRVIALLSVKAGLRAGEIAQITWPMVLDAEGHVGFHIELHDRIAKKGGGRRIPMHGDLREALIRWRELSDGQRTILHSERGGAMTAGGVANWFAVAYRELGLDGSIANAFEKKTGWLGYYWAPTAILGKYEMTKLSFGVEHDKKEWDACTAVPDCANPKVNAYPTSDVYTIVTKQFSEKAGVAMDYVKTRKWDNQTVGKVLAWMTDNQGTNEDAAKYFLQTYPDMWTKWVAPDVAEKVKAAL